MAGWATNHIARLRAGETVQFRPHGNSMSGRVEDGDLCTVAPIAPNETVNAGDVVLVHVRGRDLFHLVKSILQDGRFMIGNNRGHLNGAVKREAIYGRLVRVER